MGESREKKTTTHIWTHATTFLDPFCQHLGCHMRERGEEREKLEEQGLNLSIYISLTIDVCITSMVSPPLLPSLRGIEGLTPGGLRAKYSQTIGVPRPSHGTTYDGRTGKNAHHRNC